MIFLSLCNLSVWFVVDFPLFFCGFFLFFFFPVSAHQSNYHSRRGKSLYTDLSLSAFCLSLWRGNLCKHFGIKNWVVWVDFQNWDSYFVLLGVSQVNEENWG